MIKVLTGAYARDGGDNRIRRPRHQLPSLQEAQRGGVSTIYQEVNLVPFRTVTENIFSAASTVASACSTGVA